MALSLTQRFANGLSAIRATPNVGGSPFIGINDPRYTSFMGINIPGHTVHTALGRIEIAKSAVWVYACIAARADAVKSIPLKLYQLDDNGGRTEFTDHPIVRLLEDVNPSKDTPTTIRTATEQSICIHGRYQWKKVRNKVGIVKELYGLPTQWVKLVPARIGIEKFIYDQTIMGVGRIKEELDPSDVVYFRCLDFDDSMEGLGPLQVAVETTMADIGITVAQNAMSKNAARPSAVMTTLNKLNDSDYARENERVQRAYAGAVNAGKIILIDNAQDTKFQTVQLSPSEMQWIQEHNSHITDICAAFRTPPGVAGDYGSASRIANLGGMHRLFAEICVRPELVMYEDVLNWQLLWGEDWGRGLGWERENHLFLAHDLAGVSMFREDETSRSQRAMTAFTSGAKWDEVRAMHGLDPVGGVLGDTSFVASNLVPVDSLLGITGDEQGSPGSLGGVAEAAAASEGNPPGGVSATQPDTRPRTPPNVQEQKQQGQAVEPKDAVKALALIERKRYRKWRRNHKSGEFATDLLTPEEMSSIDDEIRATLAKVEEELEKA